MQHPDEGTIHSWLDGALSAEEATRVESHVSECASCAAAVAEARGFIAASSRILTALDDVPRGVVPTIPAKRRDFRVVWRAAAAVLIVAGGSFVVMREGGPDVRVAAKEMTATSMPEDQATTAQTTPPAATEKAESLREAGTPASADAATTAPAPAPPAVASANRAETRRSGLSGGADPGRAKVSVAEVVAATGAAAVATPPEALRMQMNEAPEIDAGPLKVVKVERALGSRRTTYQPTASELVTLIEPEVDTTLAGRIVLRGSVGAVTSAQPERRAAGAVTQRNTESAKAPAPPPPPSPMMDSKAGAAFMAATNTITWIESRTGKTLTLSGNVSVERLQEIRKRIERERAARTSN
jgi:hypothetical protein